MLLDGQSIDLCQPLVDVNVAQFGVQVAKPHRCDDQGTNAYTDTGEALLVDPKVIELYLGTLAKVD